MLRASCYKLAAWQLASVACLHRSKDRFAVPIKVVDSSRKHLEDYYVYYIFKICPTPTAPTSSDLVAPDQSPERT